MKKIHILRHSASVLTFCSKKASGNDVPTVRLSSDALQDEALCVRCRKHYRYHLEGEENKRQFQAGLDERQRTLREHRCGSCGEPRSGHIETYLGPRCKTELSQSSDQVR